MWIIIHAICPVITFFTSLLSFSCVHMQCSLASRGFFFSALSLRLYYLSVVFACSALSLPEDSSSVLFLYVFIIFQLCLHAVLSRFQRILLQCSFFTSLLSFSCVCMQCLSLPEDSSSVLFLYVFIIFQLVTYTLNLLYSRHQFKTLNMCGIVILLLFSVGLQ